MAVVDRRWLSCTTALVCTRGKRCGRVLWTRFQLSSGDQVLDRRAFIGVVAGGFFVEARITSAQQSRKIPVIGILHSTPDSSASGQTVATFRHGLRDLGYVEGQNIRMEYRSAADEVTARLLDVCAHPDASRKPHLSG